MTSFVRFSGLKAITIGAALSMTAGLAFAGDNVSSDQIIHALQPKPLTRGLSVGGPQVDPGGQGKGIELRARPCATARPGRCRWASARRSPRSPRPSRRSIWKSSSTSTRPTSARPRCLRCRRSARRCPIRSCKGSTFVVAGHTDGVGGEAYNQDLSERRADTIKQYLVEQVSASPAATSSPSAMARPS